MEKTDEKIAEELHNAYEQYSKNAGWKTQKKCQVKFKDLPEDNQVVMISIARLIKQWVKEELDLRMKELRQRPKITIKRYDDRFGYDLEEDYYKL
jgi:ribonuclease HI